MAVVVNQSVSGGGSTSSTGGSGSGSAGAGRTSYLGQVATRCLVPVASLVPGTAVWSSGRTKHIAKDNIVNPVVVFPSWWLSNGNVETVIAGGTCKAAIEIILGTRLAQNAEGNVSFTNGYAVCTFPGVTITKGSTFWVDHLQQNANGIVYVGAQGQGYSPANGEGWAIGTGAVTDYTISGTPPATFNNSQGYGPILILSQTTLPSVFITGNSRSAGTADFASDVSSDQGEAPRIVGQLYGYTNTCVGGSTLTTYNSSTKTFRNQILQGTITGATTNAPYHTHFWGYDVINDLAGGDNAAAAAARIVTQAASIGVGQKYIAQTISPLTTSTDNWLTLANQTATQPTIQYNNLVRNGLAGVTLVADVADLSDPFRTGKWPIDRNSAATTLTNATFTGVISSNTLTVSVIVGAITPGATLFGAGVSTDSEIMPFGTGSTTGTGGNGTYFLNQLQTVGSVAMSTGGLITADGTHPTSVSYELERNRSAGILAIIV